MSTIVLGLDVGGVVATAAAASFLVFGWRRVPWLDVKLIFGGLLLLALVSYVVYGLEAAGVATGFAVLFDYTQVLIPLLWMFLIAGYLQGQSTEKLASSERTLFQFLEAMPVGVVVVDAAGRPYYMNDATKRIGGVERAPGGNITDWLSTYRVVRAGTDDEYEWESLPLYQALQGEAQSADDIEVEFEGGRLPLQVWAAPIYDQSGRVEYAIAALDDITDRRAAEAQLRASEARYRALAEYSSAGVWHITPEGYTVYLNPVMCDILEIDGPEELEGVTYHEFFTEPSLEEMGREHAKRPHGTPSSYEVEIVGRRGGRSKVLISGAPVLGEQGELRGLIGTFVDISALKEAERTLRNEKLFSDTAIDCLPGIFFLIDNDGRLLRWNQNLLHVLGEASDDLETDDPLRYVLEDTRNRFRSNIREVFVQGSHAFQADFVSAEGQPSRYFITGRRFDFDGQPCALGIGIDITEQKRAEEERQALEEQLQQAQKMESIGLLAGGVAHDFNNLLVAILGYCDLVKNALGPAHPVYNEMMQIERAGEQATALTSQLLAFSRKQMLQPKVINVNRIIRETEKMLNRLLGETIAIECRLHDELPAIEVDRGQLEQVLVNLAINARDAMPEGGRLVFTTDLDRRGGVELNLVSDMGPGPFVHVAVEDSGSGMPPEVQRKIFDPFFTTKEMGKGTGLGLSTVYGIVRQSGGDIRVESAEGAGATFHLYFPVSEKADAEVTNGAAAASGEQEPGRGTVLLAEDAQAPRELISRILEQNGYEVLEAASAAEAEAVADAHPGGIDLLLTDIVMPGESGHELAQKLLERIPGLKVVYMTGYTDDALVQRHVADEGVMLLQKPFTPQELTARLDEVLRPASR